MSARRPQRRRNGWFAKADRRVSVYYFYAWIADFGPAYIKVCTLFASEA